VISLCWLEHSYQSEITTPLEVCQWAGFGDRCHSSPTTLSSHSVRSKGSIQHYQELLGVTWADLDAENATLSVQVWCAMDAAEYCDRGSAVESYAVVL
jgi:hypothetical protein